MRRFEKGLFLLFSICVSVCASMEASAQVMATVGNRKITVQEFNRKFADVKRLTVNPPTKAQFLEDLIRFEIGVQEAEKRGLDKDPIVADRMRTEIYKALLEKDLASPAMKIKVSDREMASFYKENPEIRSSHILVSFKPGANAKEKAVAKKRAVEILQEVRSSRRAFPELVKLYSDDTISKAAGGDVGWQSRMTLVPSYYDAVKNTATDRLTGLVETQFGFHIIKVTGRRPFAEANRGQVRAGVYDVERKKLFDKYFSGLKKKYKVSVNQEALKR